MAVEYVLVPGGAGYIGSHTVLELLQTEEFIPVVVDNLYNSSEEALRRIERISGKKVSDRQPTTHSCGFKYV